MLEETAILSFKDLFLQVNPRQGLTFQIQREHGFSALLRDILRPKSDGLGEMAQR